MKSARYEKWDNVKGLLIILVVIGHFMYYMQTDTRNWTRIYYLIHLFHMPLFVFISGLFLRKTVETGRKLWLRSAGYLILGYLLKYVIVLIKLGFGHFEKFHLFREDGLAWYMMAMAIWIPVTYFLRKIDKRFLLVFAVLTALCVGYDKNIGAAFSMSRVLVFYPYFFLGTMCRPDICRVPEKNPLLFKGAAVLILSGAALFVFRYIDPLYQYIDILKGWHNYFTMEEYGNPLMGFWYRLGWYPAAALVSASIVILMPGGHTPLAPVGSRTLQIYMLHRPVMYLFRYLGFDAWLKDTFTGHWHLLYICCAVILALVLSLPVFEKPFLRYWELLERNEPNT